MISKENKVIDKSSGKVFISGVAVLSFSTILVKVIGLAYKIPMLSLLGAEGMGYFNSAYEIYALLCVISTTGLPVAISMMISKSVALHVGEEQVIKIRNSAMRIALVFGIAGTILLMVFSSQIAYFIGNENSTSCIMAISPSVLLVCISSVYRGYFQGLNNMLPTAISQLIEVAGKLIFGVALAYLALELGYDTAASSAFAALGLTLGMFISSVYLVIFNKIKYKKNLKERRREHKFENLEKGLLSFAFPITLSSLIMGVIRIIDMTLILRRLQSTGVSVSSANHMYGAYTTLALPVFGLVPSLIAPISLALIPNLTSAIERKNRCEQAEIGGNAIRMTVLLALPSSMGIAAFSHTILSVLFLGEGDNVDFAAPLLSVLGCSVLFSCLITTTNAVLNSYKKTLLPVISMIFGAMIKLISEYFLLSYPSIGIMGAPISTLLCDMVIALINLANVLRYIPETKKTIGTLWRVFIAAFISISFSLIIFAQFDLKLQNSILAFSVAGMVAVLIYLILIILLKVVSVEDLRLIPYGEKLLIFINNKKDRKTL